MGNGIFSGASTQHESRARFSEIARETDGKRGNEKALRVSVKNVLAVRPHYFIFQGTSFFRGTRERLDFGKNKVIFPLICKVVAKNNKILFSITFIFAGFTDIFAGDAHNQCMTMTKRRFIGEKRTDTLLYIFATNTHIIYNKFDIKELWVNCEVSDCEQLLIWGGKV